MKIDEQLYDMIFKRKSFHLFNNIGNEKIPTDIIEAIKDKYGSFAPLYPDIQTAIKIVPAKETTCKRSAEYCILLYSEKKDNYLQNIGFIGQQLELFLVSRDIGTLWFGIGNPKVPPENGLDFVIMIAISRVDDKRKFRKDLFKSKRKPVEEIWSGEPIDGVTDIVRFAPSACNTQPWLVENTDGTLNVYRYRKPGKRGMMPASKVTFYNRIDIGIFLCFLELCLAKNGIEYDLELHDDPGGDCEKTPAATFSLC